MEKYKPFLSVNTNMQHQHRFSVGRRTRVGRTARSCALVFIDLRSRSLFMMSNNIIKNVLLVVQNAE